MTHVIRVDDYTYELAEKIVKEGKANTFTDAIDKALANYIGIRYKSPQERKLEQDYTRIMELGKKAMGEE